MGTANTEMSIREEWCEQRQQDFTQKQPPPGSALD